jgi:serine/threonine-protein kinase
MVGRHGQVYVMDWGCAHLARCVRPSETAVAAVADGPIVSERAAGETTGSVMGTLGYMAPEQAFGHVHEIDPRTDVFALGGMLYRLLTDRAPHAARTDPERLAKAQACDIVPPQSAVGSILDLPPVQRFLRGGAFFVQKTFAAGATIVREGEPSDAAYIVTKGNCEAFRTVDGRRVVLRRIGPGEVFGDIAAFTREPRVATVVALDEVKAAVVARDVLEQELDSWLGALVSAIVGRFRDVQERLGRVRVEADEARMRAWVRSYLRFRGERVGDRIEAPWTPLVESFAEEFGAGEDHARKAADAEGLAIEVDRDVVSRAGR